MEFLQLFILAFIQGVTEFLPVSSSAHLILLPKIINWADQGLIIDVSLHMGTLLAVMTYFWQDTAQLFIGLKDLCLFKKTAASHLTLKIMIATLPVVIVGFLVKSLVSGSMRSLELIGATSIIFGVFLLIADKRAAKLPPDAYKNIVQMPLKHALVIGIFQVLALVPGVSRSGITMSALLLLAYSRVEAAKFSLLLSMPTIAAAFFLLSFDIIKNGDDFLALQALFSVLAVFIFAYFTILLLMRFLKKYSFTPFVIYRILLGCLILWIVYTV